MKLKKTKLVPMYLPEMNEREKKEYVEQLARLNEYFGDVAEWLDPVCTGNPVPKEADAAVFVLLLGSVYSKRGYFAEIGLPFIVLTSRFGTVEMWDWEIISYLRDHGLTVFSPYNIPLAKTIIRAFGLKRQLKEGVKFLMFQDNPGEGMQPNIFKKFYWWEKEATETMHEIFGMNLVYKSWKSLAAEAKAVSDEEARKESDGWNINCAENLSEQAFLSAVKLYIAAKKEIIDEGNVVGIGCNCLNESMYADTTPCLAWNMLFERDGIMFACEGDTLTLLSNYLIHGALDCPFMMTNVYPFLVGMAALAHERIDKFPDIEDPDNHALAVHCGYFGLVPRQYCTEWTLRPKCLAIVDENAVVVDCRLPEGKTTLAKINANFKEITIIRSEIEGYVQYPGSDTLNGALIRYENGQAVMQGLSSHHAIIMSGDRVAELTEMAKVFGLKTTIL